MSPITRCCIAYETCEHGLVEEGIAFLVETVRFEELNRTVREVLDSGRFAPETMPGSGVSAR